MKNFIWLLLTLLLLTCEVEPFTPEAPTAILFTGTIVSNPKYNQLEREDYDDDQDPYIIIDTNWTDSVHHGIGVYVDEWKDIAFSSCKYIFAKDYVSEMDVLAWDTCEDFGVRDYLIYEVSERHHMLILEPVEAFWECLAKDKYSDGEVGRFEIWVRENEAH